MRKKNISKKVYSKKIATVMLASMMLMTGCGSAATESEEITRATKNEATEKGNSKETTDTNQSEEGTKNNTEKNTENETTDKANESKKDFMTTEGFISLSAMKEDCKFEKTNFNPEDKSEYPDMKMEAEYSLGGGSKDKIIVTHTSTNWERTLSVNNSTVDCPMDIITDAMIIDVDSTDNYKEIAIVGITPGGNPLVCVYGYVDGKIYNYGDYQGYNEYDQILFDKKGKIVDAGCYDYFIGEKYLYRYHQIKDNAVCEITVDYKTALNREYTISKEINVAFGETDEIKFDDNLVDYTNVFKLKVGEKIVIIDEQKDNGLYYVQLSDGRKGLLSREVWVDFQDTTPITIDGFISLSQAKEDYKFTKESKYVEDEMNPFTIVTGEYALNSDKKDKIVITSNNLDEIGKIKVNDVEVKCGLINIEDVVIIDIDKNDNYKEIAILDNGFSDDYEMTIFRYAEGKLYELGFVGAVRGFEDILFDKEGKVIGSYNYTYFLDTKIVTEYNMVIDDKLQRVVTDNDANMNKKYAVVNEMQVAFSETGNMEISHGKLDVVLDYENLIKLKAGEEITLIKVNSFEELYYIELPDGRKGVMTTRVAG